jgi:hypothetical protein
VSRASLRFRLDDLVSSGFRFVLQLLISLSDIFPQSDPLVDALDWDSLLVQ